MAENLSAMMATGLVFEERYLWHDPGNLPGPTQWLEPTEHWENAHTKRRFFNLLTVSGLIDKLTKVKARMASREEILLCHAAEYHDKIVALSSLGGGDGGEMATFGPGGYEIAALSVGGVLSAVDSVLDGTVRNAYCLVRPPGHHAESNLGMGFCIFNNVAIAAKYARQKLTNEGGRIRKIAIVDYDVHHGNGTQQIFWDDPDCLFISLHQDNNYPVGAGSADDIGGESAKGTNINIPLPPGSGTGAYDAAFAKIVLPALDRFQPDFIFVSSGFDASFADPLASMMLSSEAYRGFAHSLKMAAERWCDGRIVFAHEGGYSKDYVPFCGLAVVEALSGIRTEVTDHYLEEVSAWNHQSVQPHQVCAINRVCAIHGFAPLEFSLAKEDQDVREEIAAALRNIPEERRKAILLSLL